MRNGVNNESVMVRPTPDALHIITNYYSLPQFSPDNYCPKAPQADTHQSWFNTNCKYRINNCCKRIMETFGKEFLYAYMLNWQYSCASVKGMRWNHGQLYCYTIVTLFQLYCNSILTLLFIYGLNHRQLYCNTIVTLF